MDNSVSAIEMAPQSEVFNGSLGHQVLEDTKVESSYQSNNDFPVTKVDPIINGDAAAADLPVRELKGVLWILVIAAVLSPLFLFALDNTIVADAQPKIVETLGEIEKLPWTSVAFALGAVSINLIWGKVYGQFNSKWLFIFSIALFEMGSVICGAAPTMNALIVGRTICGLGGSGFTLDQERPAYLSLIGLMWGLGTVLGPIIGGAFTESTATWRWSFYLNLCVGGAGTPVYLFLLPSHDPRPGVSLKTRLREIDFLGALLIIGAFLPGVIAVSFGGVIYAWNSGRIIGLFVCSGVLWILFAAQQIFCITTDETRRLFPIELIKSYELVILFVLTATSATACFLPIYFIPIYFQFALSDSALASAVRLLPFVFVLVFAVVLNGLLMGKTGYYMPWYLAGGILVTIGSALMYTIDLDSSTGKVYGYSVILALGTGFFSQASFPVAQAKVEPHQLSAVTAYIGCAQIGGLAISISVANTLFFNKAIKSISADLPDINLTSVRQTISGAGGAFFESLTKSQRILVLNSIVESIKDVYIMIIVAGTLTVICSIFMKREKLFLRPSVAS
ncbi:hypothetical protein DSL72_008858 [Monilinia vaccinii-corymbosi]|uniref:Major facilitator superfamily (MFS) profile domain-containing protein n=1 Tax=Monilinia vaccinii-corymbosi TaxID=61207 RepID=A0A8A3PSB1_9HELO|nr:hypothetical protein DSL72_008858 [Monilinia vaccinii-corymbosi]